MKIHRKTCEIIAMLISIAGILLALFVGGYVLLFRPIRYLIVMHASNLLTTGNLIICIVKIFLSATAAGGIWIIFDIIASRVRDLPGRKEDILEAESEEQNGNNYR